MDYPVFIFICSFAVLGILAPIWFAHQIREEHSENTLIMKAAGVSGSGEEEKTENLEEKPEYVEDPDPEEDQDINTHEVFNMMIGKRIETVSMPMCRQCPYEYMTLFLEKREKIDKYHQNRSYRVKCSHFDACRRAHFVGKNGGMESDGMDGAEM